MSLKFDLQKNRVFTIYRGKAESEKMVKKTKVYKKIKETSKNIEDALRRKALGYEVIEIAEEYSLVDSELKLIKKKVNTKQYPPDLDAITMLLSTNNDKEGEYSKYTDEELLEEKHNLMELFKRLRKEKDDASN